MTPAVAIKLLMVYSFLLGSLVQELAHGIKVGSHRVAPSLIVAGIIMLGVLTAVTVILTEWTPQPEP